MNSHTIDVSVFVAYVICLVGIAYWVSREEPGHEKAVSLNGITFDTSTGFNAASVAVTLILIALYVTWW